MDEVLAAGIECRIVTTRIAQVLARFEDQLEIAEDQAVGVGAECQPLAGSIFKDLDRLAI